MTSALIRVATILAVAALLLAWAVFPQPAQSVVPILDASHPAVETRVRGGFDVTDPAVHTSGANLNVEAVQEVVVNTSAMTGEHGRAAGTMVKTW